MRAWSFFALLAVLGAIVGCGRAEIEAPFVNAGSAASAAIKQYDKNGDGELSAEELEKAPGIKAALETSDANRDGALSKSEIKNRVQAIVGERVAVLDFFCRVSLDGNPLEGATIKAMPEPCLGETFKTATGITNKEGLAGLSMGNQAISGMQCGLFRIEITHPTIQIPARYNTESELGVEIAMGLASTERGPTFQLKSQPK